MALVAGKPLIAWTIEEALRCHSLNRVIVSTETQEIAEVACNYGAEVPFMRPHHLASDETPSVDVVIHAIQFLARHDVHVPDFVIQLQPTSPLRTVIDIESAVTIALEKEADSVVSVSASHEHPFWAKRVSDDGVLQDFIQNIGNYQRRQDLPVSYSLNGAIYLGRAHVLMTRRTFYTNKTYAYVMPPDRSLDIDSPWDLKLADLILRHVRPHETD